MISRTEKSLPGCTRAPNPLTQIDGNVVSRDGRPACQSDVFSEFHRQQNTFREGLITRRRSRFKVWMRLLLRWLSTVGFIVVVYGILIGYTNREVLDKAQKRQFNALITGAVITLALITMSHFTRSVLDLRWWILSRKPRSRRKVEAILRAHSMSQVISLALKSKKLSIHVSVLTWIIVFIGSQAGYASLSLCYAIEKTDGHALLIPGNVSIPNLTTVETARIIRSSSSLRAEQYTANSYGAVSLAFDQEDPDKMPRPGTLWFSDDPLIFCNTTTCSYVFHETNTQSLEDPMAIPIVATTNRTVTAVSSCISFPVISGGDGTASNFTIRTSSGNVVIPLLVQGGADQSTFTANTEDVSCGDDCSSISVFEASPDPWYYNCTTRFIPVTNARFPYHNLGRNFTRLATAAIALQGYSGTPQTIGSIQSVVYPAASVYGIPLNGSVSDMELLLSRFAIGVLSVSGFANSQLVVNGQAPWIGERLVIAHWSMIHLIFALTAGLQLLLAALATWLADRVIVPHGGPLAEAKILQPMHIRRNPLAEALDGSASQAQGSRKVKWIYRNCYVGIGLYCVYMERNPLSSGKQRVN